MAWAKSWVQRWDSHHHAMGRTAHGDICFPLHHKEIWGRKVGKQPAGDPSGAVGPERGWQHCPEGLLAAITMVARLPMAG